MAMKVTGSVGVAHLQVFEAEAEGRDSLPKRRHSLKAQVQSVAAMWTFRQVTCAGTMACSSPQLHDKLSTCASEPASSSGAFAVPHLLNVTSALQSCLP